MNRPDSPPQPNASLRPSLLLPCGATLSVFAALLEAAGVGDPSTIAVALAAAAVALAAWFMYLRVLAGSPAELAVRFFSIMAIALAITSLLYAARVSWLGWLGSLGLWLAALGAGLEWASDRTYGTGRGTRP